MKIRVLHFITGLGVGGAENMLLKSLPLMKNDFENRVCSMMGSKEIGLQLESKGIKVYYLEFEGVKDTFKIVGKFKKVIDDFKPDLMVTYLIHADLFGRILGRLFGIKKIISSQRGALLNWEWLRIIDRATSFLIDKYIVQTKVAKNELMVGLWLKADKIVVVPNGIILNDFDFEIDKKNMKKKLGIVNKNINLVCVGNLRIMKGHEHLLKAFEKAYQKNRRINLLIVGDGDQREKLLEQCKDYQSRNNIFFFGQRKDIKEILKISDIFVLATETEGMSNAIMEAMASKLAIITTNIGVNVELLGVKDYAVFVPVGNVEILSEKILSLSRNEKLRHSLGLGAYERINKYFDIKVVARSLMNAYREVL